ncbi:TPA: hypothetical protein MDE14_005095 [Klebsiella pneumoniae]|uniref:hypothetical protein n=1 Tax=Klebsiella pneumoniae TaxID=573 RepID=UPI0023B0FD33|nr:hypothetical protein [Klebsiella pneumoniae]MDE8392898.1 hypothetical protein [Klebsiella pneumoniae]HBU8764009.1 hypothetical protein [Klebsiella pneumoniae]
MAYSNGFIRNPWSRERDSVKAIALISRIEKEAARTSGLHDTVFGYKVRAELDDLLDFLDENDQQTLKDAAKKRGYILDAESLKNSRAGYIDTLDEIAREQM